ncbi:MAG: hypothetical protein O7F69_12470, partial [Alphaproteobacteria bacterium]|nr:hypothetical protein [Alphaproteobacteria bacterium]
WCRCLLHRHPRKTSRRASRRLSAATITSRRTLGGGDAFVQRVDFSQYFVALPIDLGALNRGQAVRSGGIQDCECDHPFAEAAFEIDKRFRVTVHGAES